MSITSVYENNNDFIIGSLNSQETAEISIENPSDGKAGKIAYEVFGMVPVIGTFIGFHHAYKALTSDDPTDGWEIAKIITQIFSFLIVPQVILGLAHAIKAIVDNRTYEYEFVDVDAIMIEGNSVEECHSFQ